MPTKIMMMGRGGRIRLVCFSLVRVWSNMYGSHEATGGSSKKKKTNY